MSNHNPAGTMNWYIWIILIYLVGLAIYNFYKAKKIETQEDMMVAGRSLGITKMVFTLVCTWIGSGTFIAGAEFAYKAGWSALWMAAGAWVGIAIIYFLAAKIRTFGQYTIGDILEVRYGRFARLFGALALIISFTVIVSYQFRAGGFILNVITDGAVDVATGQAIAAGLVILFTALGGMIAVAHTDLPNGIIIVLACIIAVPFIIAAAGGLNGPAEVLPASYFNLYAEDFGEYPFLKAFSYFLATMFLLLGVQSMYQKFYSAKTPGDAKKAVVLWIIGTVVVETVVVVIAVYAASYFWGQPGIDPAAIIIHAAREMLPLPVGILLLGAAVVVVISTGMNYLLSPSTNIIRDIYQTFINKDAEQKKLVAMQKVIIVALGLVAFLLIWIPTINNQDISVLKYAYMAYTIYGVAITPALFAALVWKRATKQGGVTSIVSGTFMVLLFDVILVYVLSDNLVVNGDPWGIPSIYPALFVSIGTLIIVSLLTPKPDKESLAKIFPEEAANV